MLMSLNCSLIGVQADAVRQVELAHMFDFDAVDLHVPQEGDLAAIRDALDRTGVKPGCLNGLLPVRSFAPDPEWENAIAALPSALERTRALGFTRTMMVLMPFHETLPFDACMTMHVDRLRQASRMLADAGVRIGLEYVSPKTRRAGQPHEFLYDLTGCLRLIEAVNQPNLGVMLDSFHWHCAGESVADLAALTAEQVVAVHINDAVAGRPTDEQLAGERELPGATGVIDLAGFVGALRGMDYDGPVTCEPMNAPLNSMPAEQAVSAVSQAMKKTLA